jgi:excisionase family DNA binding protein
LYLKEVGAEMETGLGQTGERLWTPREAAKLLGVHFRTLARWAREGRVASVQVSGVRRFRLADLNTFVRLRAAKQTPDEQRLIESVTALEEKLHSTPSRQKTASAQRVRRPTRRRK